MCAIEKDAHIKKDFSKYHQNRELSNLTRGKTPPPFTCKPLSKFAKFQFWQSTLLDYIRKFYIPSFLDSRLECFEWAKNSPFETISQKS